MTAPTIAGRVQAAAVLGFTLALGASLFGADAGARSSHEQAREILDQAGIQGGLVVHLGCGDGRLTAALCVADSFLVHGLDADRDRVEQAREHVRSLGLYGKVSVDRQSGEHLPYTDNLVDLLVSEDLGAVPMVEVMRVLAPEGVAYVKTGDKWTKTVKPRPKEIDEWTHFLHGPDNNAVAQDSVVGPPHHLQWVGGPKWARSHDHLASVSAVVSSGGRIFSIVDEGPTAFVALPAKWRLVARDAFNGVILWKRPVEPWEGHLRGFRSGPTELSRTLVAAGNRVYVTLGYGEPVVALDAATGETVATYQGTEGTLEILYRDGLLFLVAGERAASQPEAIAEPWRRGVTPPAHNKRILVVKADTGEPVWTKWASETSELMPTTLAVAGGRVFFQNTDEVVCLEEASGREIWRAARPVSRNRPGWSTPTLVVYDEVVLSADRAAPAQAEEGPGVPNEVEWTPTSRGGEAPVGDLIAFSAETGERLWSSNCRECYNAPVDVLVAGGLVWTGILVRASEPGITVGRDPATGEIKRQRPPDKEFFNVGMGHHRCYRNKATERYLVLGRAGVEFIDLATGQGVADHWVRGTCQHGVVPANGLLYAPSHSCACYIEAKLNGFNALAPKRESRPEKQERPDDGRLERGPAYRQAADRQSSIIDHQSGDWPTYRHDPARSGHTESPIAAAVEPSWQAELGGRLTSVVIADGKAIVAEIDTHTVHALDAAAGERLWSYTAGGRVDSPPTIHKGLVLFGSADGCVYCLRASDGQLAWRFRAAPEDRRTVAYNQLESVWPVHGNVLVEDGAAYFVAGRSIFLDGGMYLYRLDPLTGEVLSEARMDGRVAETEREPQGVIRGTHMLGALPDVLSSDGASIYMRQKRFDRNLAEQETNVPHLFSSVGFLDGLWWHRTYWMMGTSMGSGYGGWPRVGNTVPAGRILVFDESSVYGFGRDRYAHHGSHVGLDASTVFHFRPDRDTASRRTRYHLFGVGRKAQSVEKPQQKPAQKPAQKRRGQGGQAPRIYRWSKEASLLVRAMVLADQTLWLAGPPYAANLEDLPAALEGLRGGLLLAVSATDGETLAQYKLEAPPVWDGMAAAGGRLYLSTTDGRVLCFRGQ